MMSGLLSITIGCRNRRRTENSAKRLLARQTFSAWLSCALRYFRLMSCAVTVLVSGLAVKRITAVILVRGARLPGAPLPAGGGCAPAGADELELDDPPVPTYAVATTSQMNISDALS